MVKIGDVLYDMRVVENSLVLNGKASFGNFAGIVITSSPVTNYWKVLHICPKNEISQVSPVGYIDDSQLTGSLYNGEEIADFIKKQVYEICDRLQINCPCIAIDEIIANIIQIHEQVN